MISKYNKFFKEKQMRDILNLLENILTEKSNLAANELNKNKARFNTFIQYIQTGKPFSTLDGKQVIVDPSEADRFLELKQTNKFGGTLKALGTDGMQYPISSFLKTADFGGHAAKPGAVADDGTQPQAVGNKPQAIGKEAVLVKPTQISITDKNIPANALGSAIINNPILKSTDYGRAVIECAKQIMAGQPATLPPEIMAQPKGVVPAIRDYATEYLGVLALVYNQTDFPARNEFIKWLGGSLESIILNFPTKANTPLADSYASLTNPTTDHQINISSKGKGGGAAPAISKLDIPDQLYKKKKYRDGLAFVEICKQKGVAMQAFTAMDFLNQLSPDKIPEKFRPFLPFTDEIKTAAMNSVKNNTTLPEYESLWTDVKFKAEDASDGGKLIYAIKNGVVEAINAGAIPHMQAVILEILDYNFVQQYSDLNKNVLVFHTQWPAKLDGHVEMSHKSSAKGPSDGGFSFKLGPKEVTTEETMPAAVEYLGTEKTLGRKRQP
jgi:hypothetical protein